ncbi:hypothetical protein BGZ94_005050 [Podila epigama]|nr:hypothetical protein BGZ94_005050 [Podila epigama]
MRESKEYLDLVQGMKVLSERIATETARVARFEKIIHDSSTPVCGPSETQPVLLEREMLRKQMIANTTCLLDQTKRALKKDEEDFVLLGRKIQNLQKLLSSRTEE